MQLELVFLRWYALQSIANTNPEICRAMCFWAIVKDSGFHAQGSKEDPSVLVSGVGRTEQVWEDQVDQERTRCVLEVGEVW